MLQGSGNFLPRSKRELWVIFCVQEVGEEIRVRKGSEEKGDELRIWKKGRKRKEGREGRED